MGIGQHQNSSGGESMRRVILISFFLTILPFLKKKKKNVSHLTKNVLFYLSNLFLIIGVQNMLYKNYDNDDNSYY